MIATCSSCGAKNRVAPRHLAETGKCGRCKHPLAPTAAPIEITDAAMFDALMVAPEVARAAKDLAGRGVVVKVDTDRHPALAQRFAITGIPAFKVFRGGTAVLERTGAVHARELVHWMDAARVKA